MQTLPRIGGAPLAAVGRVLSRYDRTQLADFIEVAIGLLDTMDGDPDLEEQNVEDAFALGDYAIHYDKGPGCFISDVGEYAGDEEDGTFAEDEPSAQNATFDRGPGCTIADTDCGIDDEGEETDCEDSFNLSLRALESSSGPGCPYSDDDSSFSIGV